MKPRLIELINKDGISKTYEIYKDCMFMPTKEKFKDRIDTFLNVASTKYIACFNQDKIEASVLI